MMKITLTFLLLTFTNVTFGQTESKCFQNQSLQGENSVSFVTNGNKISGTFAVENSGDSELSKTYEFTGTRAGNVLKVKFYKNELPNVAPSVLKSLTWTVLKISGEEVLRIKFHGKNYDTNKFADYDADFESCEPSYAALLKMAKPVQFAKGKYSASPLISFANTNNRQVFSINIRKGQTLDIDAVSCRISVYLPNGKHYQIVEWENQDGTEKTYTTQTIDKLEIKPIPQTGTYLVVLEKIGEDAQPERATFKITN